MKPRFVGRLGLADAVTVTNAAVGFAAAVAATVDVELAARLLLLASIADALDGVVARRRGGTAVGPYLDSLADVGSFGVTPALVVVLAVADVWGLTTPRGAVAVAGGALFVATAVTRLGLYTAYDSDAADTEGVQTTLAATIVGATVLAGFTAPIVLVPLTYLLAGLMLAPITYPDLHAQDAAVMGVVQAAAIALGGRMGRQLVGSIGRGFAFGLLFLSLSYLFLGPRFYWRRD
jgi:CDP-diacylglycerol--serine O-phosphatidyltransferase